MNHLDGHPDSGTEVAVPDTQREAVQYIQERRAAHQKYHKAKSGTFDIYTDHAGLCRWRLLDGESGEIVASSGQGFPTLSAVKKEIERIRRSAPLASIETEV